MQLFLEVLNDVLEFRDIFRGRHDQGLVSFQHRLRPIRSSSSGIGRACPSFFMALTRTLKSWSNPKLHSDSAFRSLRLTTDRQLSPSSPSHNEIPASVPINVESIIGQLHRSTMNSRAPRCIISLAKSFRALLFVDEPLPSTRTQTIRSAQLTNISVPGFIALSHIVRCCSLKVRTLLLPRPKSPMIFRTGATNSLINAGNYFIDCPISENIWIRCLCPYGN